MELNPQAGRKLCSTDLGSFPCEVVLGLGSRSARCQHRAPFGAPSHAGVCTPKRSPGARGCRLGRAGGSVSATQTPPQARSCHGACGHAAKLGSAPLASLKVALAGSRQPLRLSARLGRAPLGLVDAFSRTRLQDLAGPSPGMGFSRNELDSSHG